MPQPGKGSCCSKYSLLKLNSHCLSYTCQIKQVIVQQSISTDFQERQTSLSHVTPGAGIQCRLCQPTRGFGIQWGTNCVSCWIPNLTWETWLGRSSGISKAGTLETFPASWCATHFYTNNSLPQCTHIKAAHQIKHQVKTFPVHKNEFSSAL